MQPFTCPHCGSHSYTIQLAGCNVTNATLEETLVWNEEAQEYGTSGTILVESDGVEPQDSQAVCAGCEQDVTEAVSAFEATLAPPEEAAGS